MDLERVTEQELQSIAPILFEPGYYESDHPKASSVKDALFFSRMWYSVGFCETIVNPTLSKIINFFLAYDMVRTELICHLLFVSTAAVLQHAYEWKGYGRGFLSQVRIKRFFLLKNRKKRSCQYNPFTEYILDYASPAFRVPVPKAAKNFEDQVLYHAARLKGAMFGSKLIALAHRLVELDVVKKRNPARLKEYQRLSLYYLALFPERNVLTDELESQIR